MDGLCPVLSISWSLDSFTWMKLHEIVTNWVSCTSQQTYPTIIYTLVAYFLGNLTGLRSFTLEFCYTLEDWYGHGFFAQTHTLGSSRIFD